MNDMNPEGAKTKRSDDRLHIVFGVSIVVLTVVVTLIAQSVISGKGFFNEDESGALPVVMPQKEATTTQNVP